MCKKLSIFAASALAATLSLTANASTIPYPDVGNPAPANSFVADADGIITAYFYGTGASYDSQIGMLVNGVSTGVYGLWNHGSSYGESIVLGDVNAGDEIVFELDVFNAGISWYSMGEMNTDGLNHSYSTDFVGDEYIPMGTYVAFEDLPDLGDFDFNDHQFVFSNVRNTTNLPEPGSIALLGLGLAALGFARKRSNQSH